MPKGNVPCTLLLNPTLPAAENKISKQQKVKNETDMIEISELGITYLVHSKPLLVSDCVFVWVLLQLSLKLLFYVIAAPRNSQISNKK